MRALLSRVRRPGSQLAAGLLLSFLFSPLPSLRAEDHRKVGLATTNLRRTPIVEVVERNKAAVVNIHSERTVGSDQRENNSPIAQAQQRVNGMGTGVVIDPRGYIVTNNHVVDDVQLLRVRLHDGTNIAARIVAKDPAEDLAIIKVDATKLLPTAIFGTATDLMLGEPVIAIGNAFGYEHTVSVGVVSATKRDVTLNREISYKSLIQTDASINPGNSGGPLFNIYGEVIGINVAIRAGAQGIGFAIPIETVMRVGADLLSVRRRTGVAHGLVVRDVCDSSENPVRRWAMVDRVDSNTPAEKAGLKVGDMIEKAGDIKVACALDLERSFLDRPVGDKLNVTVRRGASAKGEGGKEEHVHIVLKTTAAEKAPALLPADLVFKKLGMKVQPVAADAVARVNPQLHGGLLITEVAAESVAFKAGLQRGDILIGLHQWETISVDNIAFVLNHPELQTFSPLRFFKIRSGQLQRGLLPQVE